MYNNAGGKLKGLVAAVTSVEIVLCCLFGMLLFFGADGDPEGVWSGLAVAVLGSLLCWIMGLALATLGEIGEKLVSIDNKIADPVSGDNGVRSASGAENTALPVSAPAVRKHGNPDGKRCAERILNNSKWRCQFCGAENSSDGNWCAACGKHKEAAVNSQSKNASFFKIEPVLDGALGDEKWCCTGCGTANRSTAKFCNCCGKSRW